MEFSVAKFTKDYELIYESTKYTDLRKRPTSASVKLNLFYKKKSKVIILKKRILRNFPKIKFRRKSGKANFSGPFGFSCFEFRMPPSPPFKKREEKKPNLDLNQMIRKESFLRVWASFFLFRFISGDISLWKISVTSGKNNILKSSSRSE